MSFCQMWLYRIQILFNFYLQKTRVYFISWILAIEIEYRDFVYTDFCSRSFIDNPSNISFVLNLEILIKLISNE